MALMGNFEINNLVEIRICGRIMHHWEGKAVHETCFRIGLKRVSRLFKYSLI